MADNNGSGTVNVNACSATGIGGGKKTGSGTVSVNQISASGLGIYSTQVPTDPAIEIDITDYINFFLGSKSTVVELETLEISHPSWSQTYYVVRNAIDGLTATNENGEELTFDYYPLTLEGSAVKEDLDYVVKVKLGDLGEIIPTELDNTTQDPIGFNTKPTVIYRSYRSDDLSKPMFGPLLLQINEFNFTKEGAEFEARAPLLNINRTGEIYDLTRFYPLKKSL